MFLLSSIIYHLNRHEAVNRIFAILCIILGYLAFAEYMLRQSESYETAYFWRRCLGAWPLFPAVLLHFVIVYIGRFKLPRRHLTYFLIYSPVLPFIIIDVTTSLINLGPSREYWGYTSAPNEGSRLYWIALAWAFIVGFLAFFLCLFHYVKSEEGKEKHKVSFISIALIIPILVALITEVLLPAVQFDIPGFLTTSFSWSAIVIAYAIWRFEALSLDSSTAVEKIVSIIPEALFISDVKKRIIYANRAASNLLQNNTSSLIGNSLEDSILDDSSDNSQNLISKTGENNFSDLEVEVKAKNGTVIPISMSSAIIRDREDEIAGYIFLGHDIKKRKLDQKRLHDLNDKLKLSNSELARFIKIGSHHLQEPLRIIAGYVQLLKERYKRKLGPEADIYIDFAVDGSIWMKHMINDLVSYSDLARKVFNTAPVDCNEVLKQAIVNLQVKIERLNGKVTHSKLPAIMANEKELVRLFQDLIGNALKFIDSRAPRIHVSAEKRKVSGERMKGGGPQESNIEMWIFSVRDNGIGIPMEYSEKIFDIFEKLHPRTVYYGTGIGLSICKKIVERHGGNIWVESEEGKGSMFYFTMPVREE